LKTWAFPKKLILSRVILIRKPSIFQSGYTELQNAFNNAVRSL